mgnify:CR=1 FL=1
MTKKEATELVLDELARRLPKNHNEGFLPSDKVYEAIELLRGKK